MALRVDQVSFEYRTGRPVLRAVSAVLEPGSITAIVGPNGAGKSTLLRLMLGVLEPASGTLTLDGAPIGRLPHRVRARHIAYVPQRPSIAFAFTVREFVSLGRYAAGGGGSAPIAQALRQVDLADRADDPFPILSVGQQQGAALARALVQLGGDTPRAATSPDRAGDSRILLADEPVSAMDPRHALRTMALLRALADGGAAVGVVLHDLTLALRSADRAIVLDQTGRLAAQGPSAEILTPAVLDPVFGVRFTVAPAASGAGALIPALAAPVECPA